MFGKPSAFRLAWFSLWGALGGVLYVLVNGAGHMDGFYFTMRAGPLWMPVRALLDLGTLLRLAWGPLFAVLVVCMWASWKLSPQWSPGVVRAAGYSAALLAVLAAVAVLFLAFLPAWEFGRPADPFMGERCSQVFGFHAPGADFEEDIVALLGSRNPRLRKLAIMTLSDLRSVRNVREIRRLLEDPDAGVAEEAKRAIESLERCRSFLE